MATNSTRSKKPGNGSVGKLSDDPPILVGGGGSTVIWLRKDIPFNVFFDPSNLKNGPKTPSKYYAVECMMDVTTVESDDGNGNQKDHQNMNKKKHRTAFE